MTGHGIKWCPVLVTCGKRGAPTSYGPGMLDPFKHLLTGMELPSGKHLDCAGEIRGKRQSISRAGTDRMLRDSTVKEGKR